MPIEVTCPCGYRFRAAERLVGQQAECPGCHKGIRIAGPTVSPFDVFISYSSKDHAVANAVVATLEARGLRCWLAPRDIVPGKEWSESIIEGIGQCRVFALIFSANSNASQQVVREVERAVNRKMPIIPFRVEDLLPSKSMEYFISSCHWLDAFRPPLDEHLEKLAATCRALLTGTAPPRQDAKDGKGLVRAAAAALLARDHRARLLVALTLACLFIGTLVVVALVLLRDPKASPEVVETRVAAENALAQAQKATAGQGVEAEVQAAETALRTAQGHFEQKRFAQAKAGFEEVGRLAAEAQSLGEMKKSRADFEEVTKRIDVSGLKVEEGTESWKASDRLAREAEKERRFAEATQHYRQAREKFEKQAVPQLRYLTFWAGYAPRVIEYARQADAAHDRLEKLRLPLPLSGPPFPTSQDSNQAWGIFRDQCVPQLGIDAELSQTILTAREADKVVSATNRMATALIKRFGPETQKWYALGYNVAGLTGYLEHHVRTGTEISAYAYLRYSDYFAAPTREMITLAFLAQRLDLPPEARAALLEAAFDYVHTADTQIHGAWSGVGRYRPCLERYRRFSSGWFKDSRSAVAFLSRSTPRLEKLSDEQWKAILEQHQKGAHTLIFPDEKGEGVSWVFAAKVKSGTDLAGYLGTLPPLYRLDLGAGEGEDDNSGTVGAVLDQLGRFTSLRELGVRRVPMTDAQLAQVGKLSGLRRLTLWFSYLKAAPSPSLEPLAGLKELRVLSLDGPLGNDALRHLAGLTNLEELYLRGQGITAEGLAHLKGLKKLKVFDTMGVKRKDVDEFRAEIPGLSEKKK